MRRWQKSLLTVLVLLLLSAASAYWYLQKTLAALPVQNLQYDIKQLSLRQLQLHSLSFSLADSATTVTLRDIRLSWQLFDARLTHVQLGSGEITVASWPQWADAAPDANTADSRDRLRLPDSWQLPQALPDHVELSQLALNLPCAATRCQYLLSAEITVDASQLQYQLALADADSPGEPRLRLSGDYHTVQQLPLLNLNIDLDNTALLQLRQQLNTGETLYASGSLTLDIAPPSPWLLQQAQRWQLTIPDDALARFSSPVAVKSDWQLQLPSQPTLANIATQATGNWQLSADLPSPLTLPGIGQLQGKLNAALGLSAGELSHYQLNSQLHLQQLQLPQQLRQQGLSADSLSITLSSAGQSQPQLTALPLQFDLTTTGNSAVQLAGSATLNLTPPFSATLQQGNLTLNQQQLTSAEGVVLDKLTLQSRFNAYWLADSWQLDIDTASVTIAALSVQDIGVSGISLKLADSRFSGDSTFNNLTLASAATLSVAGLRQPQLKPLSWQWQATMAGSLAQFTLDGRLSNTANLGLTHQLVYQPGSAALRWQLDDMFLLAGNPLAATLADWPPLLELNRGRLMGSGQLVLLPELSAQAQLTLSGVSGIFDRSLFKDLTAALQLQYQQQQLLLSTQDASLAEINHGIVAGPLLLSARYNADATAFTEGKLDIQRLQLQAMGGQVLLQPQQLDLALAEQQLQLELQKIDLTQLLQQHPSTDISGNGRISGIIPLLLSRSGASVLNGLIAAESPGGSLQYRPPTAQSMAASNPGMKVVLNALDDFHYSVLSSNVSYDTNGKLLLALQLQGSNPALEGGRAINLNINLEEDIPALITSLQLSSQISDKIKQRVQQKIQQSGAMRANGAKP